MHTDYIFCVILFFVIHNTHWTLKNHKKTRE